MSQHVSTCVQSHTLHNHLWSLIEDVLPTQIHHEWAKWNGEERKKLIEMEKSERSGRWATDNAVPLIDNELRDPTNFARIEITHRTQ